VLYRSGVVVVASVNLPLHGSGLDERKDLGTYPDRIWNRGRGPRTKKPREPYGERTSVRMYSLGRIVGWGGSFLLFHEKQRSLQLGRRYCACCSPAPLFVVFVVFVSKSFLLLRHSMEIRHHVCLQTIRI
jgi:hypothetical protein